MKKRLLALATVLGLAAASGGASAAILDAVRQRGMLNCGIYTNFPGFSSLAADGACYLAISLTIAGAMNACNERAQIHER